jgi:hypothetical protein
MGKKTPSAPAAPDPAATAAAQSATNKDTAYWNAVLNNVNQITPYGSLTYTQSGGGKKYNTDAYNTAMDAYNAAVTSGQAGKKVISANRQKGATEYTLGLEDGTTVRAPGAYAVGDIYGGSISATIPKLQDYLIADAPPEFTSKIELSPEQKQLLDIQNRSDIALSNLGEQQIGRIASSVASPFSYSGLGDAPTNESIAEQQTRAEEAILSRLNPQFSRDEEAMRTRLINQGITQGSEAYRRDMEAFNQSKNDARLQAILQGQQYGGTAQQQALQRRNQAIQEYSTQRNAPLNEFIGLTSGSQIQNPQFSSQSYGGAAPVDYAGLVNNQYQSQLANYNAKVASQNANRGLFGQVLGAAAGFAGGGGSLFGASNLPWQASGNVRPSYMGGGFY